MTPEDERALEHAARMGIRQRMRPPKPRTGWALVVLAVAVVLLFGLGLWVAVPWQTEPLRPSDREVVHELAQAYLAKHPSVRGPPEAYREEARRIEHAVPRTAAERLTRALALDPDDVSAWLHLVVLSSRSQAVQELGPIQAREVVAAILETRPEATLLPAAQAWLQIQAGAPQDALVLLGEASDQEPADARWARLRAIAQTGGAITPAARHLLAVAPTNPEACEHAARAALAEGDWFRAAMHADTCLEAGVESSVLNRVRGEVAWVSGDPASAAAAWETAGLGLHASAARAAAGDMVGALRLWDETLDGPWVPPVAIRAVWLGLQGGDGDLVEQARKALAGSGEQDPTLRHAWAAGELFVGNPTVALATLDGLTDPFALFLRALATEAPTDAEAAFLANPTEPAVASLAARVLGADAWTRLAARDPLELELGRRLPSIDEPWQAFDQEIPSDPAWQALVGHPGPPPENGPPLGWWAAAQRKPESCPPAAPPSALAWCLRLGDGPVSSALVSSVPRGTVASEVLAMLSLPDDQRDAFLATILGAQPTLAGLVRERYYRQVRAEERTPTP